jgi:hypothetical protein
MPMRGTGVPRSAGSELQVSRSEQPVSADARARNVFFDALTGRL